MGGMCGDVWRRRRAGWTGLYFFSSLLKGASDPCLVSESYPRKHAGPRMGPVMRRLAMNAPLSRKPKGAQKGGPASSSQKMMDLRWRRKELRIATYLDEDITAPGQDRCASGGGKKCFLCQRGKKEAEKGGGELSRSEAKLPGNKTRGGVWRGMECRSLGTSDR